MKEFDKQMEMVLYHSDDGDISVDAYINCGLHRRQWQIYSALINLASADI